MDLKKAMQIMEKHRQARKIKAPWSPEKVRELNARQDNPQLHPYTCPGDKPGCKDNRSLIATPDGWVCACGEYKQDWSL